MCFGGPGREAEPEAEGARHSAGPGGGPEGPSGFSRTDYCVYAIPRGKTRTENIPTTNPALTHNLYAYQLLLCFFSIVLPRERRRAARFDRGAPPAARDGHGSVRM